MQHRASAIHLTNKHFCPADIHNKYSFSCHSLAPLQLDCKRYIRDKSNAFIANLYLFLRKP